MNLESASLDDLLPQADTWERVLRKLSARAMPPQGMPHPTEGEYVGFTTWLAASLDRAWEGRSTPGRYVMHRLNRSEYANAVRDLLAVDIDMSRTGCRPTARTSASTTSPRRSEPRRCCSSGTSPPRSASARWPWAIPGARPGTTEYSISREFSQNGHIEGLPLGTRGGTWSVTCSRPTPSTSCRAGWSGASRKATPASRATTRRTPSSSPIDGAEVYSAPIGGPEGPRDPGRRHERGEGADRHADDRTRRA